MQFASQRFSNQPAKFANPARSVINKRNSGGFQAPQHPAQTRTFSVDPENYKPKRVGIKRDKKVIVIEFCLRSTGQRFLHYIKVYRYTDPKAFGISGSRSGSFKAALD